jgi:hypothetical protein
MAGTVTVTEENFSAVKKIKWSWTSDAAGAADQATSYAYTGALLRLVTEPGSGADQPTDLYDVTVTDEDGYDVLAGAGANRSNASTEQVLATNLGAVANDKLTMHVTNAGDTKKGTVVVYLR